jgi:TatD DNase family protein
MLVDSHCHLNDPRFDDDLEEVLARARTLEVTSLLSICTSLSEMPRILSIVDKSPSFFASVGVHPHQVGEDGVPSLDVLIENAKHPKVVGFGETGLDYYYENTPRLPQQESFRTHIRAAKSLNFPLIIHSRDAEEDILKILDEEKIQDHPLPGVIHCFSGTSEFAEAALKRGFYISISGIVTFKNAEVLRDVVKKVPLDRLLVETDSPYLAPIPHRGKRNEPSFVVHTAEAVASLKDLSLQEVAAQTTKNFFTLFHKAKAR